MSASDQEFEKAKARLLQNREAVNQRLKFTLSQPKMDDRGVIVGSPRPDHQKAKDEPPST